MSSNNYELKYFFIMFIYMIISLLMIKHNKLKIKHNSDKFSKHIFNEDIPKEILKEIDIINNEILQKLENKFKYVPSITELYYSTKNNSNSDKQFTALHMDGPFYGCNFYRVLIGINCNRSVMTNYTDYD